MKAIMYHYVRPDSGGMPYFRYLALDDFRRQLDYFGSTTGFVDKAAFLQSFRTGQPPADGVVLTFDDGLSDHVAYVLPELSRRGLWGIFYVATGPYATGRVLDVHRIHTLLGRYGGAKILAALGELLTEAMIAKDDVANFREVIYLRQNNDQATDSVKRILNYFITYEWRRPILDRLMTEYFAGEERELVDTFYMSPRQISELQAAGMVVGSHSETHPVFSRLDEPAQRQEIENSFAFLDRATGGLPFRTYCHPYGGFHSFDSTTEQILTQHNNLFAFNVEPRDISTADLSDRPQALPRFDCNQFPHGSARLG